MEEKKDSTCTEQSDIVNNEECSTACEPGDNQEEQSNTDVAINPLEAKVEELEKSIIRVKADYDNFRRRTVEEKIQLSTFITAELIGKLLPTLDTFRRARNTIEKTADEPTLAGIDMIIKQFEQTLEGIGVEKIVDEPGTTFDPVVHEAVMSGENPDLPANSIEMVFEDGYKYKDKVIRHTKVKVVNS